jgi:hypothetical protein
MGILNLPILEYLSDVFPPIVPEQLPALESDLGVRLPADYKSFLSAFNGGTWDGHVEIVPPNPQDEWDIITLGLSLGITPDESWIHDIRGIVNEYGDKIPDACVPIMHGAGHSFICVDCRERRYGQVLYWFNSVNEQGNFVMRFLADSFGDFLLNLRPAVIDAIQTDPVFAGVERGDKTSVREYLQSGGDPDRLNDEGWTLAMCAAHWAWPGILKLLLDAGANSHAPDDQGLLPMHHAIAGGSLDSVKLLLGAGTNLNHRDEQGRNWARVAEEKYQHRIQRFFERLLD